MEMTCSCQQETWLQEQGGMVSLSCHPGRSASHIGSVSWMACRSLRRMAAAQWRGCVPEVMEENQKNRGIFADCCMQNSP